MIKKDKVYKVLAIQHGLSNSKAKDLCDKGLVYMHGKRVNIARAIITIDTKLVVKEQAKISIIFEDNDILAINKPAFMDSYELEKKFAPYKLLHRLDKETSGVIIMTKNEPTRSKCIREFQNLKVYKEYVAIVHGLCSDEIIMNDLIETKKYKNKSKSFISRQGKPATTTAYPISYVGKKSKIKVIITHGRTHQIRVHLAHHSLPIVGDIDYGFKSNANRMLLHSKRIKILDYDIKAKEGREFEL
jgi:23S rRNA pseudouridine1911/1915/1917 synthase